MPCFFILAKYKHLPIYKLTYDLLAAITKETRQKINCF